MPNGRVGTFFCHIKVKSTSPPPPVFTEEKGPFTFQKGDYIPDKAHLNAESAGPLQYLEKIEAVIPTCRTDYVPTQYFLLSYCHGML